MQRVKVGMIGLAIVLLLIGLASAIFSSASKDKPVDVAGGPKADVVANISITNDSAAADAAPTSEPLAELGVSPSTADPGNQTIVVPPAILTQPPGNAPPH
ncbi:hypothetical protein EAH79_14575 [Sphingomonas koreensis]|nr:hypothetical protein EAH79_14575 [Sphingomonas koreensis]